MLGNASVTFNGVRAPLIFVSGGQINLVAPIRLLALERARVAVTVAGQTSSVETVNVAPAAPGIFFDASTGLGAVVPARAARPGETVSLFVTGLGDTTPPPIDGDAAPLDILSPSAATPRVTVGGVAADVRFSGLAPSFSGLYQINFDVPLSVSVGTEVPVTITVGERVSNTVRMAVAP